MLGEKQARYLTTPDQRINLLSGSVRSGKTWISLLKFALIVAESPKDYEFLMCGRTTTTLKRNCLGLLYNIVGENFTYSLARKQGELFGRRIWLEAANDNRAEAKIRGLTLGGAYVDELTEIPADFYKMLLSRLSLKNAKLTATTNPDAPGHWVKTDLIDNENIEAAIWSFFIDDNPFLDADYVRQIKNEYSGVFYSRFIDGQWTLADGLIYPDYALAVVPTQSRDYTEYQVSIDYGTLNPFAAGLYGLCGGVWYLIKEYHHSGRATGRQKTDNDYLNDLSSFIGDLPIEKIIIDPSAASFIALLRQGKHYVRKADNDVLDGIRETAAAMKQGLLKINDCCWETIKELQTYSWDVKSQGEDRPIKVSDHHCDHARYFVRTNRITRNGTRGFVGV